MSLGISWDDYGYEVLATRLVTPVIRELHLAPVSASLPYLSGQYVLLSDRDYQVPPRSYSVANAPRPDGRIELLVTRVDEGATSSWVHDRLRVGDHVTLSGPYGTFLADPSRSGPVLLLAAGSGLAPARALAQALLGHGGRAVTLIFSARTRADTIDHELFVDWAAHRDDFDYLLMLTRDADAPSRQHVPELLLGGALGELSGWEVFASGPPGFVTGCAAAARRMGAEPAAIHTEEFFADPQPWTGPAPTAAGQQASR